MSRPVVEQFSKNSLTVKQKYFDASILTIPLIIFIIPGIHNKTLVSLILSVIILIIYQYTRRIITITKDNYFLVQFGLRIGFLPIRNHQYLIDRNIFNVTVHHFISGGISEVNGIHSYTIHLCENSKIIARISGFKDIRIAEEVAQQIRS